MINKEKIAFALRQRGVAAVPEDGLALAKSKGRRLKPRRPGAALADARSENAHKLEDLRMHDDAGWPVGT